MYLLAAVEKDASAHDVSRGDARSKVGRSQQRLDIGEAGCNNRLPFIHKRP